VQKPAKLDVVVGGQFGSEAKGHVAAQLAQKRRQQGYEVTTVRVAGPNAGHSAIGSKDGKKWALRQVPITAVVDPGLLCLAAGSEIDEEVLQQECDQLDQAGYNVTQRLVVDAQATVLEPRHKQDEKDDNYTNRFGSTGKGVGAARIARLARTAATWGATEPIQNNVARVCKQALQNGECVIVEGTQGYGLGLHAGFYPYSTSSDCRAIDFLAMAGINPWQTNTELQVWVVARSYPIRVAGNSGPLKEELTWEQMNQLTQGHVTTPELTTVTQKPRRIGNWDPTLVKDALEANGAPSPNTKLILTFADYIDPQLANTKNVTSDKLQQWLELAETELQHQVTAYTTGPDTLTWLDNQ
jgi:adenylosuccinate synthase